MKKLIKAAALLGLAVSATIVYAGARQVEEVFVDQTNRIAYGSAADARGSADNNQFILCFTNNDELGGCTAVSAMGGVAQCWTTDKKSLRTIAAMSSESRVYFTWDNDGACEYIEVANSSIYKPRALTGF